MASAKINLDKNFAFFDNETFYGDVVGLGPAAMETMAVVPEQTLKVFVANLYVSAVIFIYIYEFYVLYLFF